MRRPLGITLSLMLLGGVLARLYGVQFTYVKELKGHGSSVSCICFSPDGCYLAAGDVDGMITIWSIPSFNELKTIKGHKDIIRSVCFSSDTRYLASASHDSTINVWNTSGWTKVKTLKEHNKVISLSFSPDGKHLASGDMAGIIKIWDITDETVIKTLIGHKSGVTSLAFSPDGRYLASENGRNTVKVWKTSDWKEVITLKGYRPVSFSSDGRYLATGDIDVITIWEVDSWNRVKQLEFKRIAFVGFHPSGKYLFASEWRCSLSNLIPFRSREYTIGVWDTKDWATIWEKGIKYEASSIAFSPDGKLFAFNQRDTIVVFELTP